MDEADRLAGRLRRDARGKKLQVPGAFTLADGDDPAHTFPIVLNDGTVVELVPPAGAVRLKLKATGGKLKVGTEVTVATYDELASGESDIFECAAMAGIFITRGEAVAVTVTGRWSLIGA